MDARAEPSGRDTPLLDDGRWWVDRSRSCKRFTWVIFQTKTQEQEQAVFGCRLLCLLFTVDEQNIHSQSDRSLGQTWRRREENRSNGRTRFPEQGKTRQGFEDLSLLAADATQHNATNLMQVACKPQNMWCKKRVWFDLTSTTSEEEKMLRCSALA